MIKNDPFYVFGGPIFDGSAILHDHCAVFRNDKATEIVKLAQVKPSSASIDLKGSILSPGYVDLQVNGGNGVLLNDDPSLATIQKISDAHQGLGVNWILPTLITDTKEVTKAAIDAAIDAIKVNTPIVAGLHLEGPHLSIPRKGAHDAKYIRPMDHEDLNMLLKAAEKLPILKITIAPENTTLEQVKTLSKAGVLISLGHSDADFETCKAYFEAGARLATHLFNAMSQLTNREPGLVGAALGSENVSAGLIADGIHVHPETIKIAWASKAGKNQIFLVSDAMAVAGTDLEQFELSKRSIFRLNGKLTLQNGTLAGADLELTQAIKCLTTKADIPLHQALAAATTIPGSLIGKDMSLKHTKLSDAIFLSPDLSSASRPSV